MHRLGKKWLVGLFVAAAVLSGVPAFAQTITTGTISGSVVDPQGGVLPGATVVALHTPTGTAYEAVSQSDGRFTLLNVRVGGPYTVTVKMSGFKDEALGDIMVGLGEDRSVSVKLKIAGVTETVQVSAAAQAIDTNRAGAGANISNLVKETLPTISRSLYDIARVNPLFNSSGGAAGDGSSVISVAGSSFRYNSLQIDGAVNNDLFGLSGSAGTPGGGMDSQPIAFDAIQEIQLVVSPYDVRQGGFSGGGINAITKSGSNALHGSVFYFGRNQAWVGKGVTNTAISKFKEQQGGGSLGGRLIKNRAFFFGSGEGYRRLRPVGISVGNTGVLFNGSTALVDQYLSILKNTYGYEPSANPKAEFSRKTDNEKYFGRLDFNLAKGHQMTVRHNFVHALTDVGTPSQNFYKTPDNYYRFVDKTNSTVAQLNSTFGRLVNELRVAYTTVRDHREPQPFESKLFPQVNVTLSTGITIQSGREQFSTANQLDQDILEITDSLTLLKGRHELTVGTSNQLFDFRNLFIRDNFGTYSFSSLANFAAGKAQGYDYSYSATTNPQQAAAFGVNALGFYVGDIWRVRPNVTVTLGARLDIPLFPDTPSANPTAERFGYRTDTTPSNILWSPRIGFNYDIWGDGREQIRGGAGIFSGRPPYVWISNQYGNTGVDFTRVGATFNTANQIPFVTDVANQAKIVTGATAGSFTNEIDLIDPTFKYPSVLRGNLAWDRRLPLGFYGSAEFVWSLTQNDIKYQNLNYVPSVTLIGVGGRPFFIKQVSSLSDVILLTNTTEGSNWTASYEVRRPFRNGWYMTAAYSYNEARTVMDGTSDQAASTWGNVYVPGDPNNAPNVRSNFAAGHRITATASYDVNLIKGAKATVSMFYSGQSGRPYTLAFGRDVNGDGRGTNDLFYMPASATEGGYTYTGGTYNDLLTFIQADSCLSDYIGKIIPRNACRGPWTNTLDGKIAIALPFRRIKAEITLDALNLINLFDNKGGLFRYASFNEITAVSPTPTSVTGIAPFTGYNLSALTSPTFSKFLR
ncbi:MAG: TonB-dependent receptor, partial [Acidobacteria bacterium]|nr:TonB-dependent receptor [Acidobacteriota bacterium]